MGEAGCARSRGPGSGRELREVREELSGRSTDQGYLREERRAHQGSGENHEEEACKRAIEKPEPASSAKSNSLTKEQFNDTRQAPGAHRLRSSRTTCAAGVGLDGNAAKCRGGSARLTAIGPKPVSLHQGSSRKRCAARRAVRRRRTSYTGPWGWALLLSEGLTGRRSSRLKPLTTGEGTKWWLPQLSTRRRAPITSSGGTTPQPSPR